MLVQQIQINKRWETQRENGGDLIRDIKNRKAK